jgi:polar amino acid transport system substrate-binding protein
MRKKFFPSCILKNTQIVTLVSNLQKNRRVRMSIFTKNQQVWGFVSKVTWGMALAAGLVLGTYTSLASDAQAATLDEIKKAGKVRVAVFGDKPPFGYVDANGENKGYDLSLAHRVVKDLVGSEKNIEYVLVEPSGRIEALNADKVDIVFANFTVTEDRAKQVDFARPYMKVALGVVSPEKAPITDVAQLKDKKLIVIKGTTADFYFTKNHPEVTLVKYDRITEAFTALRDGRGAGLSNDNTLLFAWARNNPGFVTGIDFLGEQDTIAPAVKKGNTELLNWLNDEITKLHAEKFFQGAYDDTLKPVYGDSVDPASVLIDN